MLINAIRDPKPPIREVRIVLTIEEAIKLRSAYAKMSIPCDFMRLLTNAIDHEIYDDWVRGKTNGVS